MKLVQHPASIIGRKKIGLNGAYVIHLKKVRADIFIPLNFSRDGKRPSATRRV